MNLKYKLIFSIAVLGLGLTGCLEPPELTEPVETFQGELDELFIPEGFQFGMTYKQEITLNAHDADGKPIAGILYNIYTAPLSQGGKLLGNGVTDLDGSFTTSYDLAYGKEALYAYTAFEPLARAQRLPLDGRPVVHEWGSTPVPNEGASYRFGGPQSNEFSCQTGLYQVIYASLKKLNVATGTYTTIGNASRSYNGIGYNSEDNFIYGVERFGGDLHLWQIDNTGTETDLGVVAGINPSGLD